MATTVLIIDDHDGFRARARRALEADGYDVVGEAQDAAGGLAEADRLSPDVVLLDVHLPDRSGLDVAGELAAGPPPRHVVLVSTYDETDVSALARRSGARGFLPKGELSGAALAALIGTTPR